MSATGAGKPPACLPTWRGHVETTKDALLIFQACFNGTLQHCFRRPHDRERAGLIRSGNVFVYEEGTSGIKRWTDGVSWSPSRILTNFLIYRQLNMPFPPGEKKRATKRSQRPLKPGEPYPSSNSNNGTPTTDRHDSSFQTSRSSSPTPKKEDSPEKDTNRGLVGSLVDSYEFKENGLLKKTMTVSINGVQHHLVSYYGLEDAKYRLKTPREDDRLKDLTLDEALIHQPKFKFPNLDDAGDGAFEQMDGTAQAQAYAAYYNGYNAYSHQMGYAVPAQPYAYHSAYAPSHPPPHGSYAHGPHASGSYQPVPATAHYPPHHAQGGYYAQHAPVAHYPSHPPQHAPGYPPQGYSMPPHQQTPPHTRHSSHPNSESVPRTSSSYDHPPHAAAGSSDIYSAGNTTGAPPGEHQNSTAPPPPHAQTWPGGGYSQAPSQQHNPTAAPSQATNQAQGWQARPDAGVYTDYRSQP